ncbi:MAG: hypothetical protein K0Q76_2603 [Panacagrimonas sp.]|jgi:hypothetical protein|nr:hypothetical protein [Panacagrimonas sp.]MCC2657495.1 hypothetical protein [Panacagrimonas sp.]
MSEEDNGTTTIWRSSGGKPELIARLTGLPHPIPGIGFRVPLDEHGDGVCIGYEYEGPDRDAAIIEVKLLVSATLAAARKWRI